MFGKNRNKKVGLCLMVVTASLVLAVLWAVLGVPGSALGAGKSGGKKGSGQGALHGCITLRDADGDRVLSDSIGNKYCDGEDSTILGLLEFFRFKNKLKKNGAGRRLFLDFTEFTGLDPKDLPAEQNIWILGVNGTLADWRAQGVGVNPVTVMRKGNLHFGKTGKDEANVSFGRFDVGDPLTVTRIGTAAPDDPDNYANPDDVWTIESFATDTAVLWRDLVDGTAVPCGSGSMPFLVTYDGREPSP